MGVKLEYNYLRKNRPNEGGFYAVDKMLVALPLFWYNKDAVNRRQTHGVFYY